MKAITPTYKTSSDEFSPDAFNRRMQQLKKKKKKTDPSGMKPDSTDDQGNSKLSSIRKVTTY